MHGPGRAIRPNQSLVRGQGRQAAIKLLALSNMELEAVIAEEVAKNPLLEVRPGEAGPEGGLVVTTDSETGDEGIDAKGSDAMLTSGGGSGRDVARNDGEHDRQRLKRSVGWRADGRGVYLDRG